MHDSSVNLDCRAMSAIDLQSPRSPIVNIEMKEYLHPPNTEGKPGQSGYSLIGGIEKRNGMGDNIKPTNVISLDAESHKFHKYLDRVQEIVEGRNSKIKRSAVRQIPDLANVYCVGYYEDDGISCNVVQRRLHLLGAGPRLLRTCRP